MNRIAIIGKGKVGQSLAKAIRASGRYKLGAHVSARAKKFPLFQNDVVIIVSKDDKIAEIAKRILAGDKFWEWPLLIVHCAGSLPSETIVAKPSVLRLTLHPIQTFPKPDANLFRGIHWMASSNDAEALKWARQFTKALGAKGLIELPSESLPLYHAMTVFSSNFITLLMQAVELISKELKQDPKRMKAALKPLMESALRNALAKPAHDVLTGPIAREDTATIRKHQPALSNLDPNLRKLYDAFLKIGHLNYRSGV
jgi:predicted short-subunit dehydrogenase-like oxidoreductase (DUF2520 family)